MVKDHAEMMDKAWEFIKYTGITENEEEFKNNNQLIFVKNIHKVRDVYYNDLENNNNIENEDVFGFLDRHGIIWE